MKKIKIKKIKLPLFIVIIVALIFTFIVYWQKPVPVQYISEDLKISLSYPKGWYIDDRYQNILLTDYETNQNKNDKPSNQHIKIQISKASLCQQSIEEDLILGGCGEGQRTLNKILNKESKTLSSGNLQVFRIQYPDNSEKTIYYLQGKSRTLQVSKEPDPSQFEKEFEEIINSIKFMD